MKANKINYLKEQVRNANSAHDVLALVEREFKHENVFNNMDEAREWYAEILGENYKEDHVRNPEVVVYATSENMDLELIVREVTYIDAPDDECYIIEVVDSCHMEVYHPFENMIRKGMNELFDEYETDILSVGDFGITINGTLVTHVHKDWKGKFHLWAGDPYEDKHAEEIELEGWRKESVLIKVIENF